MGKITVWNPWRMVPNDFFEMNDMGMELVDEVEMDIYERGDMVFVELKAPGFNKDDIKIQIESNMITVSGSMKEELTEEDKKGRKYYRREIRSRSFSRTSELPTLVDADKANALFKNGMLKISLPKREEVKPKTISVEVSE